MSVLRIISFVYRAALWFDEPSELKLMRCRRGRRLWRWLSSNVRPSWLRDAWF